TLAKFGAVDQDRRRTHRIHSDWPSDQLGPRACRPSPRLVRSPLPSRHANCVRSWFWTAAHAASGVGATRADEACRPATEAEAVAACAGTRVPGACLGALMCSRVDR